MTEMAESVELLFFDTFSHETSEELNLDLVQFPKPVFVTEVRIIPLGARVQADFPGGVRLGATNPSQFSIEFFVNDLGKPGASTFESLGGFEYNQNGCIHLECINNELNTRQIPTDGLVLRGWYTTITLAVYGTLTKNLTEQILPPVATQTVINQPQQPHVQEVQQIVGSQNIEGTWPQDVTIPTVPLEYNQQQQPPPQPVTYSNYVQQEQFSQEYHHVEYYNTEPPKDPRYHHTPETDWDTKVRQRESDNRGREPDHVVRESELVRESDRHYSRSHSRDRERRDYREPSRDSDREWDRERSQGIEVRDREWDRGYNKHQEVYKRSRDATYGRGISAERDDVRKRPRTPPIVSPKRPHTPHGDKELSPGDVESISEDEIAAGNNDKVEKLTDASVTKTNESKTTEVPVQNKKKENEQIEVVEELPPMDVEVFEPILSDEDICDEAEYQEMNYDFSAYSNNDDIIKLFNPITSEIKKYSKFSDINIKLLLQNTDDKDKIIERIHDYFSNLNDQTNSLLDIIKPYMNKYNCEDFRSFSPEIKEEFVNISEQLPNLIIRNEQYQHFLELYLLVSENKIKNEFGPNFEQFIMLHKCLVSFVNSGLDFELAFSQNNPGFKIRHIKCGIRLAETCCMNSEFVSLMLKNNEDIHMKILNLFDKEYMALSIKLMILKALDASLTSEKSIEHFVGNKEFGENGYQMLINMLKKVSSVRLKFALNSLITKLNIYEILKKIKSTILLWCKNVGNFQEDDLKFVIQGLEQVLKMYQRGSFEMSQPKRFLPVSTQFEINRSEEKNMMYTFFSMHQFLECLLVLLTHPKTVRYSTIIATVHEFINELMESYDGIVYLSNNVECMTLIMKYFFQPEDMETNYLLSESVYIKSQSLGLKIAYKLKCFYLVEKLLDLAPKEKYDCDASEVLEVIHELFCLTYVNVGKLACSEILSLGDNIKCLLQFLQLYTSENPKDDYVNRLKKSPGIGYMIDILTITIIYSSNVSFLEKYGKQILSIAEQHENFEANSANRLKDIMKYLKPLEISNIFSYDDIKPLCEILKENIDNVVNFPPQLITTLRILRYLGISDKNNQSPVLAENSNYNLTELKYKYVILQLYSFDGVTNLVTILQKICDYYEQPILHASTFISPVGALIMNILLPTIQLLQQMLMLVINCRNTEFKDLTAIPILLQTYNLAHSFPQTSIAILKAREVCREIINVLLVYSQPISDEVSENDSLNKTLWTLMAGEVIKYVTIAPYRFIPGLLVLSELLPLPLPIQTKLPLTEEEVKRAVNLRKLWSAHLHSHSTSIQELISRLCTSVHQPVLHLLRRICIQFSDLAANSALMIARGILDSVLNMIQQRMDKTQNVIIGNGNMARLLHFLACLTTHCAVKCAILQLLNILKIDEKYSIILTHFCQILKTKNDSPFHVQTQECIVNVIQNLCDTEITLVQNCDGIKSEKSSEKYLSNSLPSKDVLIFFISTMIEHLIGEHPFQTILPIARTFLLLTEHDYGFYHLYTCLEKKGAPLFVVIKKLANCFCKDNPEMLKTLNTVLEFLRVCTTTEQLESENNPMFSPRTMKISFKDLRQLLAWKQESDEKHPLHELENLLKNSGSDLEAVQSILDSVTKMIQSLNSNESDSTENIIEVLLPPPDMLLAQFSCRLVYTFIDLTEKERLTTTYWLSLPQDDGDSEAEYVTCDIMEIWRQHLSTEINLNREIERLIRVCPVQNTSDRPTLDQGKNKRSIEQQKGERLKKPYITPMRGRGFPRVPPQRGDLFRSRPPNTSRPPSLHVDDFVALETCGAQPTGPTGYNKLSRDILNTRVRSVRGRTFISPDRGMHFRPL